MMLSSSQTPAAPADFSHLLYKSLFEGSCLPALPDAAREVSWAAWPWLCLPTASRGLQQPLLSLSLSPQQLPPPLLPAQVCSKKNRSGE